jgi:hypothetical protein
MRFRLAAFAATVSLLAASPAAPAPMPFADAIFPTGLPAAVAEDACATYRCVYDARHQGNGTGQSLILTRYQGGFLMKPVTHERAHWLQAQYCDRPSVNCDYKDD